MLNICMNETGDIQKQSQNLSCTTSFLREEGGILCRIFASFVE